MQHVCLELIFLVAPGESLLAFPLGIAYAKVTGCVMMMPS